MLRHPQYGSELFLGGVPKSASEGDAKCRLKEEADGRKRKRRAPSQPIKSKW